jgi:hypothetical protein
MLRRIIMTKEEAVRKALEYVQAAALEVGPVVEVKFVDLSYLDEKSKDCPPDLLETYNSVRKSFRNQWVVTFKINDVPGQVSCPGARMVRVFETGEVTLS